MHIVDLGQLAWPSVVMAVATVVALAIRLYARHRLMKIALRNVKQGKRAEVIKATALLLDERRFGRRANQRNKSQEGPDLATS